MTEYEEIVDPWVLVCTDPTNDTPAYLSDGITGIRIGRDGSTLVTAGGDSTYSSSAIYVPEVEWSVDNTLLDPTNGTNYRQTLDLRTGVLATSWEQQIGSKNVRISSYYLFDGELFGSARFMADQDAVLSTDGPGMDGIVVKMKAGVEWGASDPRFLGAIKRRGTPEVDIEIDGPVGDQRAIRSFLFYLRQSMGSDTPPGPMGLSNDTYNGHIFWDSDVWMFPALAFVDPNSASQISNFRSQTVQNVQSQYLRTLGGRYELAANAIERTGHNFVFPDYPLRYPWESDASGNDVTEGPTVKEDHQSGGVAWSLDLASALGLQHPSTAKDIGTAVAHYYKSRLAVNENGQSEVRNVTGVDEWFEGDNCLYTNAIADWTIKKYLGDDVNMYYPRDEKGLLAYDGDQRRAYQQAAAPLILWPLEREDLVDDPIAFLDLFEGKESPNGPAMSLSVYALIRARYGDADEAYETWRNSWKKYTDGNPLMLFSERPGRSDLTYFLTGAAGCLNSVIYGFIGVRIVDEEPPDEAKLKIENGKWLVIRPNLPKAWKSVTFKGMQVLGKSYTVHCVGKTATITLEE